MSEEIIKVLDNLAQKFGIAIDWTSQNIMPYLQELMSRFIKYKTATDVIWLIVGIVLFIVSIILFKKIQKWRKSENFGAGYSDDEMLYVFGIFGIVCIISGAIAIIICYTNGIIQNIFVPELTVIKYLKGYC